MLREKRGTHVGFVLSFVIFVTFLLFLYAILIDPVNTGQDKQFILDKANLNMIKEISSENLTTLTIEYVGDAGNPVKECIQFNIATVEGMKDIIGTFEENLLIKNETGDLLNYTLQGGNNQMKLGILSSDQDALLKIYYSKDLENQRSLGNIQGGCKEIDGETKMIVRKIREESQILETKVTGLIDLYEIDYINLSEKLEIPEGSDFSFSFEYANGTIIKTEKTIPSINVYAGEFLIPYLDKEGNVLLGKLKILVW